jgi:hypothetical protein
VLGLIFLKYISDAFDERHAALLATAADGADAEDPDEYRAANIFWVPKEARWGHLQAKAKQATIGKLIDDAMLAIERDNKQLKGVLPKDYARSALDKHFRLAPARRTGACKTGRPSCLPRWRTAKGSIRMPWRTIEGQDLAPATMLQLEVLVRGMFDRRRFLDLIRYGVVFDRDSKDQLAKILAGYHQFHAVGAAVEATVAASRPDGDRRCGVVWHTQGSGKSLTMVFYAGRIILHPSMENPTIVVLTDRNDLDGQLFDTFARCREILRQQPVQAGSRAELRELLAVASGGVVFTTIQKFFPDEKGDRYPLLSDRRNIVVIADEAHRSQYDFIDGFARHMRDALPNASFIGFTGTPIELSDKNTKAVFGDYILVLSRSPRNWVPASRKNAVTAITEREPGANASHSGEQIRPTKIPKHRAHKGSCLPLMRKLRDGIW